MRMVKLKLGLKDFGFCYVRFVKNDCCYICCRETIMFKYYTDFDFVIANDRVFSNEMVK